MPQAITLDQFRQALTDPDYAVAVIIANNPDAVADQLRGLEFIVNSEQDMVNALNQLLEDGNTAGFKQALTVPVDQSKLSADELKVLADMSAGMRRAAGGGAKSDVDLNAIFGGLATGTLYYLNQTGQGAVNPTNTAATPPTPPKKDNTLMYVLGGVAIVVLVVVLIVATKGKAKPAV